MQIKICAEYWGMLPRPRLVCQESGLRPDTIHFPILNSSMGLVGNLAELPLSTVPSAIVQNEDAHQTIKSPSMPCPGAAIWKYSLVFMPQKWWNWQTNGGNLYQWEVFSTGAMWMESFIAYLWVIWLYFSPESRLISGVLELGQVSLFCKKIGQEFDSCQTWVWKSFPIRSEKYEDTMLVCFEKKK